MARRSRGLLLGGLWLHCLTWWRAPALDAELAGGADPIDSDELSLRAGQLGSAKNRGRLVRALEGAIELADRQPEPLKRSSVPPLLRRAEVRACRPLLVDLAERLRDGGPLGVEGLAMTSLLVTDGASPLCYDGASRSLAETARSALIALEPRHPTGGVSGSRSSRHPRPRA